MICDCFGWGHYYALIMLITDKLVVGFTFFTSAASKTH